MQDPVIVGRFRQVLYIADRFGQLRV